MGGIIPVGAILRSKEA